MLPQFKEKREQAAKHAREIERKRGYPQDHVGLVDLINGAASGLKQQQQVPSFGAEATAPTPPQAPQQTRQQLSPTVCSTTARGRRTTSSHCACRP